MKKIELRKKRRFNGLEDEITKNNYQLGFHLRLSVCRFLVSFRNHNTEALNLKVLHLLI